MKFGPKETKQLNEYLRTGRNRNRQFLTTQLVDDLESGSFNMADGGRIGFRKGTPIEDYPPEVQQRIKDYGVEKYNKLNKNQKYDIRNPKRLNKTFNFKFKGNKFPTQVLGLKDASAKNTLNFKFLYFYS